MADVKISGLPASTTPLAGTEVLPVVQGGTTKQVSIANVTAGRSVAALSVITPTIQAEAGSAGGTIKNGSGVAQMQWGSGGASNLSLEVATNINPANAAVNISPTGTGTVNISPAGALSVNPTAASTINNTSIGATTAAAGRFSSLTNTSFTAGSVVFAGASGVYSQDNANLFWDDTNNRLGIGASTLYSQLTVQFSATPPQDLFWSSGVNMLTLKDADRPLAGLFAVKSAAGSPQNGDLAFYNVFYAGGADYVWKERMRVHASGGVSIGNTTDKGAASLNVSGLIYPQQAATASAPAYAKGAIYFDTTLNKLRIGGATAWETVTSV